MNIHHSAHGASWQLRANASSTGDPRTPHLFFFFVAAHVGFTLVVAPTLGDAKERHTLDATIFYYFAQSTIFFNLRSLLKGFISC
jgi:hypothetical protein